MSFFINLNMLIYFQRPAALTFNKVPLSETGNCCKKVENLAKLIILRKDKNLPYPKNLVLLRLVNLHIVFLIKITLLLTLLISVISSVSDKT